MPLRLPECSFLSLSPCSAPAAWDGASSHGPFDTYCFLLHRPLHFFLRCCPCRRCFLLLPLGQLLPLGSCPALPLLFPVFRSVFLGPPSPPPLPPSVTRLRLGVSRYFHFLFGFRGPRLLRPVSLTVASRSGPGLRTTLSVCAGCPLDTRYPSRSLAGLHHVSSSCFTSLPLALSPLPASPRTLAPLAPLLLWPDISAHWISRTYAQCSALCQSPSPFLSHPAPPPLYLPRSHALLL